MDEIIIENLQVYAYHGVYREENEKGQNFYINAVLETDTRQAGILDDLDLSTNYGEVCMFLSSFVQEHTCKLIETVAERTAEAALLKFPRIRRITLEVRKPEAPIPLPFGSVSVKITRGWHRVYLSCGSNMGDRQAHLEGAVQALRADDRCRVLRVSDWIATAPYGGVEQADFLNGAIAIDTLYTPEMLLEKIHEIECAHGRERKLRWGPRTLDLDILLYEDLILHTEELVIPHADMPNRYFVLKPLAQIAPYAMHPVLHRSVGRMYETLMQEGVGEEGAAAPVIRAERLTLEQARDIYAAQVPADFPPDEIKPFAVIEEAWERDGYFACGFYEGTTLCAYAFLVADVEKQVLLLDYFAVSRQRRGEGIGSRALGLLRETCGSWNALVVEVEDDGLPDTDEETRAARKRRISFYANAGCLMSAVHSRLWGVDYRIMVLPLRDPHASGCMAEKLISIYKSLYSEETLRQHLEITVW